MRNPISALLCLYAASFATADYEIMYSPSGEHYDGPTGRYCTRNYECRSNLCFFMRCAADVHDGTTKGRLRNKNNVNPDADSDEVYRMKDVDEYDEDKEKSFKNIARGVEHGIVIRKENAYLAKKKEHMIASMSYPQKTVVEYPYAQQSRYASEVQQMQGPPDMPFDITKILKITRSPEGVLTLTLNYDRPTVAVVNGEERVLVPPQSSQQSQYSQNNNYEMNANYDETISDTGEGVAPSQSDSGSLKIIKIAKRNALL